MHPHVREWGLCSCLYITWFLYSTRLHDYALYPWKHNPFEFWLHIFQQETAVHTSHMYEQWKSFGYLPVVLEEHWESWEDLLHRLSGHGILLQVCLLDYKLHSDRAVCKNTCVLCSGCTLKGPENVFNICSMSVACQSTMNMNARIFLNNSVIAKLQLFGKQLRGCHRISLAFLAGYQKKGPSIVRC